MWGDTLTGSEVEFCDRARNELAAVAWAQPLLNQLPPTDALSYADKPLLFELRLAWELNAREHSATYESPCGIGTSSVDFEIRIGGVKWRVELVSIGTSEAVKRATVASGIFFGAQLSSDAMDATQSEEGEIILVQQKIGEKVFRKGTPTKFPSPEPDTYHVILVDVRGFGLTGGDRWDYREIAYGPAGLPPEQPWFRHHWRAPDGSLKPILGLFDEKNTHQKASALVRQRIHLLGFSYDEEYSPTSLLRNAYYLANPHLLDDEKAEEAFNLYPLRVT